MMSVIEYRDWLVDVLLSKDMEIETSFNQIRVITPDGDKFQIGITHLRKGK